MHLNLLSKVLVLDAENSWVMHDARDAHHTCCSKDSRHDRPKGNTTVSIPAGTVYMLTDQTG